MLIEVRPGEGGEDAERFADELFGAMLKIARASDDTITPTARTFTSPDNPLLEALSGTHRVQRIPKGAAARHTSTATVAVLDEITAGVS